MPPMTRRRSARIASAAKAAPNAATPTLEALVECDEPREELPRIKKSKKKAKAAPPADPPVAAPRTPVSSSPVKPSNSEMHPSRTHVSLIPPSSAVRLGFADIPSARRDSARKSIAKTTAQDGEDSAEATAAILQATPSKVATVSSAAPAVPATTASTVPPSSSFTFRFNRTGGVGAAPAGLSEDARRMMDELREKATMIRADLVAERAEERAKAEAEGAAFDASGRRIAKPKGPSGRFSAAHTAEFNKMGSIENHPSAFRAAAGRFTPVKSSVPTPTAFSTGKRGLKRTQSKASLLEETPKKTPAAAPAPAPATISASTTTRAEPNNHSPSVVRRLFASLTSKKTAAAPKADEEQPALPNAKRMKQNQGDDTSSSRTAVRDGSSLPRPAVTPSRKSGIARPRGMSSLMTPTRSSMFRSTVNKTPSMATSALKKPSIFSHTPTADKTKTVRLVEADKEADKEVEDVKKCALPVPKLSFSKTPAPPRVHKQMPAVPATTPSRKLVKHVTFTPTTERALFSEKSPSLFRSFIPRSGTAGIARPGSSHGTEPAAVPANATVSAQGSPIGRRFGAVLYPDLSKHHLLLEAEEAEAAKENEEVPSLSPAPVPQASAPGTFTFRSDKTISFGEKPVGFGASPGQASVRHVRMSMAPVAAPAAAPETAPASPEKMPGGFPKAKGGNTMFSALVETEGPDKENTKPVAISIPHGIVNKKRHRVSEAEEAAEEAAAEEERMAKRRKNERVPEGAALMAPRLVGKNGGTGSVVSTPRKKVVTAAPSTAKSAKTAKTPVSAMKKRSKLTMSRLNSLATPKYRK